jgi:RND family efflux transporter MFP subunit
LALSACGEDEADPRLADPLVRVATVTLATGSDRAFTGIIAAKIQSDLGFRVPGKVVARLVDAGQPVKLGQSLMRIDNVDYENAIATRTADAAAARAKSIQADADEARYRGLMASGTAAKFTYDQAKLAADSAREALSAAEAQERVAKNQNEYSTLSADADGVIVETLAEPGQVVAAGQVVVKLAHAGPREAAVSLPEGLRPQIGSSAKAILYDSSSVTYGAQLRQLSGAADPKTRTYDARYVLEGKAADAPLGATVTIHFPDSLLEGLVEVPLGAIYDGGKGPGVWLVDTRTQSVVFRPIHIRQLGEELAVVSGELREGERVVALGAELLHEGEKIRIEATQATKQ